MSVKEACGTLEESAAKQHLRGKLSFYERIERLVDKGSFQEIGALASSLFAPTSGVEIPRDGVMTGFAAISGRRVVIASQDFSQKGGTLGLMHSRKVTRAISLAVRTESPFIFIGDSGGARIQEGVDALAGFGEIFKANVEASGKIPQIAIILGPCAGGAAYSPALMDFIFMVDKISNMFVTGPKVVKDVTGEDIGAEELGGAKVHSSESGVCSFFCQSEDECFEKVKVLLSYLENEGVNGEKPLLSKKDVERMKSKRMPQIIPSEMSKPYDVRKVVSEIADEGKFLEVFSNWSLNIFTGFARIDGINVGVVANNPQFLAGVLDSGSSCKAARFIRLCDCFGIPLLTLVDVPGYMPGGISEHGGIIRHGAKMLYAYAESSVAKVTVIIRKAFGGAYIAMCSKHLGADIVYAFSDSQIAVMGAEGAVDILCSKELESSEDPASLRKRRAAEYAEEYLSPFVAAKRGYVDEVIDMGDVRGKVVNAFRMLQRSGRLQLFRHGNIPL